MFKEKRMPTAAVEIVPEEAAAAGIQGAQAPPKVCPLKTDTPGSIGDFLGC